MLQTLTTGLKKRLSNKSDAPAEARGNGKRYPQAQGKRTKPHSARLPMFGAHQAPSSTKPENREFVVDSGASIHMLNKKDPNSAELDTFRVSRNPTTVIPANGEVQTTEEATVYVYDLDLIVTVQIVQDAPVVLSLGKLCEDHGKSHEWTSGQKTTPH